jgi:porin
MTAKTRRERGVLSAFAAMTCGAPGVSGQTVGGAPAARNGSHYKSAQTATGLPAAGETTVELAYLAQVGPWVAVQPDVQYVLHPRGTRETRNALVLGLRLAVSH